jgi:hypothetical protein
LVIEVPNRIRDSNSSSGRGRGAAEGDFGTLAAAGDADQGAEAAHPRLGGDVELGIDRRLALNAILPRTRSKRPAGEIVCAADQARFAGDAGLGDGPATRTSALHSLFMPSPVTLIWLGALTFRRSCHGIDPAHRRRQVGAERVGLADVQARHLCRGGGTAEAEATPD